MKIANPINFVSPIALIALVSAIAFCYAALARQAASATIGTTVNAASYTVPGTLGNDVFVLTAGNSYYGGGGDDTYIISPHTLRGDVTAKIIDTEGDNLIQLVDGMVVATSSFYTDAAQLTLSSGAKVQILGASKFKFQLGANALAGDTATALNYTEFVISLGASLSSGTLPAAGTAGYFVPTGFVQAAVPVPAVAGSSYTVPGTLGDDVLVPSGGNNYLGGAGNDTYIISPYTLSGKVTAKIIDTEGVNTVQFVRGLTIASSIFYDDAMELTLSNGSAVQILGASGFVYQLDANASAGETTSDLNYAQFVAKLRASVPPTSTIVDISQDGYGPTTSYSDTYCSDGIFPTQWDWRPEITRTQAQSAVSGTPLIKQIRNGVTIATYNQLSGSRGAENNTDGHDTTVGPFHRSLWYQMQDGDVFEIYPAVYSGATQQMFIGPNYVNTAAYNAEEPSIPKNITIRGITVNGFRPVIINPSTGASNETYGQGLVYVDRSENITIENIDIVDSPTGGYIGKAGIYVNGATNLTLRNMRISGFKRSQANGIFGTSNNIGVLLLENVELKDNGGANGPEHNAYIGGSATDPNFTFRFIGGWSHGAYYGHALKSRAQITVVEGSYLSGTRATPSTQTETYLLDVPNGGTLIARNNVFVKNFSGNNSNAASLTFAVESNSTNYDMMRPWDLTVEHNTFVAFSREYDTSGVYQRWLRPFFINQTSPGNKSVQHNAFVGYCDQANANNNFMGTNYTKLNFNQIDMAFRPRSTLANGSASIVGSKQYVHEAMSALRTTRQIGAKD